MAMRFRLLLATAIAGICSVTVASAAVTLVFGHVTASKYDPGQTFLVQAVWSNGIGCPTGASVFDGTNYSSYTDAACPTGDASDTRNQGLLLAKTGPTSNDAAAQAHLTQAPHHVTELGYDIRKPRSSTDASGSHCGNGAPRFDIVTASGAIYFLGCNSPAANTQSSGTGWTRLRWDATALAVPQNGGSGVALGDLQVRGLFIIFDEGQDTAPDNFGMAILDNVDVNGTLVGRS
jgi:hypothetical protein